MQNAYYCINEGLNTLGNVLRNFPMDLLLATHFSDRNNLHTDRMLVFSEWGITGRLSIQLFNFLLIL